MNKQEREIRKKLAVAIEKMSPERRLHLNQIFESARDDDQPMMQQMSYGGEHQFYDNCRQVELNGDFSKKDLIKIAQAMNL